MRKRLTDEERMARKRAANRRLLDSYRRYDGERGSTDQWRRLAEGLQAHRSGLAEALKTLRLNALPDSLEALRAARNRAMLDAHPDRGGSDQEAAEINKAFEILEKMID